MKIKTQFLQFIICATFTVVIILHGCISNPNKNIDSAFDPEGVFAQLIRIDAQNKSEEFKTLMAQLIYVADSIELANPYYWICYQESPNHFWLLSISDSLDNFVHPGSIEGFASSIGQFANPSVQDRISTLSESLKELPMSRYITQQYANWSTTNNVESRDFPKSRIVIYQINESDLLAFHDNMADLSDFLSTNNTTLQVEGFIAYPRTKNSAWQVIFLPENESFINVHDNYKFKKELTKQELKKLTSIQEKIKSNIKGIEYYDGIRIDSLSFGTY